MQKPQTAEPSQMTHSFHSWGMRKTQSQKAGIRANPTAGECWALMSLEQPNVSVLVSVYPTISKPLLSVSDRSEQPKQNPAWSKLACPLGRNSSKVTSLEPGTHIRFDPLIIRQMGFLSVMLVI